jgi:hypothetical protein
MGSKSISKSQVGLGPGYKSKIITKNKSNIKARVQNGIKNQLIFRKKLS